MAQGVTWVCTGCERRVEAWDEGEPYVVRPDGGKRYVYHPDPERARAVGVESPVLCLACGAEARSDSRAPLSACPACGADALRGTWHLGGCRCPACRRGRFEADAGGWMIS